MKLAEFAFFRKRESFIFKNKILSSFDFIFKIHICSRFYSFFGIMFRLLVGEGEVRTKIFHYVIYYKPVFPCITMNLYFINLNPLLDKLYRPFQTFIPYYLLRRLIVHHYQNKIAFAAVFDAFFIIIFANFAQ